MNQKVVTQNFIIEPTGDKYFSLNSIFLPAITCKIQVWNGLKIKFIKLENCKSQVQIDRSFFFLGLSLLTLVIVCVAEPNLEELLTTETTQTREGKGKFEMTWLQ